MANQEAEMTMWQRLQDLLDLDYNYAPWNLEKHEPSRSLQEFSEGLLSPIYAFVSLSQSFDIREEAKIWGDIISDGLKGTREGNSLGFTSK
ncbi:hypothetical protein GUITHDRAFT_149887 [Guillardia theta CCMP2712]|uniref:Uncharacterized protein n=1 Tax=Guillardia theta (strain CCMP2712) TaxID=905079 RepID=L1K2P8_GUITC|nr:hypothetical protein GUITHDRAFT_149887 [Guillardia theta CCMP2712]EKX54869.1 hypothetical protein GUITHDRAFT_149887 [Guillardia theta CCMP2712]|eukprot:XP_005841849.1 hypothetical protein GUITHDRAFT_149887 [Guillardia theta CCMP2712]